jgi:hypothetical protein
MVCPRRWSGINPRPTRGVFGVTACRRPYKNGHSAEDGPSIVTATAGRAALAPREGTAPRNCQEGEVAGPDRTRSRRGQGTAGALSSRRGAGLVREFGPGSALRDCAPRVARGGHWDREEYGPLGESHGENSSGNAQGKVKATPGKVRHCTDPASTVRAAEAATDARGSPRTN